MKAIATPEPTAPSDPESRPSQVIYHRASEILLKLLDGIERDITDGKLPSPHMAAYEVMVRAEQVRTA
jgi:hypothetical protein